MTPEKIAAQATTSAFKKHAAKNVIALRRPELLEIIQQAIALVKEDEDPRLAQLAAQVKLARTELAIIAEFRQSATGLFAEKALSTLSEPAGVLAQHDQRIAKQCALIAKAVLDLHEDSPQYAELCRELKIVAPQEPVTPGEINKQDDQISE